MITENLKLEDLVTFQRGFDITVKDQIEGNIPVISSGGISSYHNEYRVEGPGVVIGRKGTLGTVHFVEGNFWPHDTTLWVKDYKGNDPKFIYYYLKTLQLERFDAGASNPTLNRNHIHKLKVQVPKFKFRSKIASILSAYDELIENNNQRIAILEQMTEENYNEWFVRFRFPNHDNTPIWDGLPEGWMTLDLQDVFSFISRGVTPEYADGSGIFAINQKVNKGRFLDKQHLKELDQSLIISREKFAHYGDILLNSLGEGTLGRVHFYTDQNERYPVDQHMSILRSKTKSMAFFIYMFLQSPLGQGKLDLMKVGGTNMTMINISDLRKFKVVVPHQTIIDSFYQINKTSIELKQNLINKNEILQEAQDLLLPRLISGKFSVEHLVKEEEEHLQLF
ncbi:restriction endonuclease subunit S [Rufibacter tibetensis]|uniref:Type I restriction modification DNA specificity domain-containing protein n=1 Tax=Rufibacter tibetensis TaxID=512763 RepID=A0A0P0CAK6_9BACT|nr:restriction endonuclease subunit S [Rufibacter tibetensis]ALI98563.1 hypothetical protein DC20_05755 [Rufibacter tibetensis]